MLIRNVEIWDHGLADLRIAGDRIAEISPPGTLAGPALEADGGALLPGLHDHHMHLAALAVRAESITCGPPEVTTAAALAERLATPGEGWLRGVGYHESVMGLPGAAELDRIVPDRPLRIQHRSGRMWLLNSCAVAELLERAPAPPGLERDTGGYTGRLFDEDEWLQDALNPALPDLAAVSAELARFGLTGVTDMSPRNGIATALHVTAQANASRLHQHCVLAGTIDLAEAVPGPWKLGPVKLHLHEADLPDPDDAARLVARAHDQGRAIAIHCVSEVELVFALAVIAQAGAREGDRIEHASVASPDLVAEMRRLGLCIAVQPHFVAERGDRYLLDVEPRHIGDLYRLRSLADAGIALAGGSDAPFGSADPWRAMAAAVSRRTAGGAVIGAGEALTPEQALRLFLADPMDLRAERRIAPGAPADVCLLDAPWNTVRDDLGARHVRATLVSGRIVHQRVDEAQR